MTILKTSDLIIDTKQRTVSYGKQALELPSLSFDLLLFLVKNSSRINSIDNIINSVWKNNVSDETVTQRVALIRKELKQAGIESKLIESVRGQGYRWLPSVKQTELTLEKPSSSIKILALFFIPITSIALAYFSLKPKELVKVATINEQSREYIKQGQFYLGKFDADSNDIAIDLFDKALQEEPRAIEALIGQSVAYSHELTKYNGPESLGVKAIQLASLASQLAPRNAASWSSLGYAYDAAGDINSAIAYYQKSLSLDANNTGIQASLAYLLMIKGHLFESLKLNMKAIDGKHHYRFLQVAQTLELLGFHQASDSWYQKSLQYAPDNVVSISTYAKYLFSHQRTDEALSIINESINKNYHSADIYVIKSLIHFEKQQNQQAVIAIQKAVSINDKFQNLTWQALISSSIKNQSISNLSFLSASIDKHQNSVSWPETFILFSIVKSLMGEMELAMITINRAIELGYRNKAFLSKVGTLLNWHADSQFKEHLDRIETLVEQEKNNIVQQAWLPKDLIK
ncbi:winged helix-turn-helix domain-containing protein [Kangiella sp. HZ709]|uniref:winged helix-turn-helix domain-containing protein n=1 Tax=Kangiella sp. HZ709 TaxID=2666328 RepID=UPI0012B117EB|nr:winged helix-turn-helix domain-containing protein [Kangiella sp. HZ709]MRX27263.1 tetratricopeptide repeat protein [Kangiella sp. HZ709]